MPENMPKCVINIYKYSDLSVSTQLLMTSHCDFELLAESTWNVYKCAKIYPKCVKICQNMPEMCWNALKCAIIIDKYGDMSVSTLHLMTSHWQLWLAGDVPEMYINMLKYVQNMLKMCYNYK